MKITNCLLAAFSVFILQSAVIPFVCNGISQPNLIFLFVVLMALRYGQRAGVVTAVLGGFCQDVVIGNFFGLHLLPYLIIAVVCSYLGRVIDKDQWIVTILIVLGATECCLFLNCAVLFISGQFIHVAAYILEFTIPMLIYHGILALPVDHVVWHLRRGDVYYEYVGYRRW